MNNRQLAQEFSNGATTGKGSNMFIDGNTIYSYGYHYPIARHLQGGITLINASKYSSTTLRQLSHVKNALETRIIETPSCKLELAEQYLVDKMCEANQKRDRAKKQNSIDTWLYIANKYREMLQLLKKIQ